MTMQCVDHLPIVRRKGQDDSQYTVKYDPGVAVTAPTNAVSGSVKQIVATLGQQWTLGS